MKAKSKFRGFVTLVLVALFAVLAYPLRGGESIREATADEITQQVPAVLDILSARHPFKVGILRATFRESADQLAEDYVRSTMEQENRGMISWYATYYLVAFDQDEVRQKLADSLEKKLGLA
jgi:hypothetical protein